MSFINEEKGRTYSAGDFLAHEECERKTRQVTQSMARTTDEGSKYVPAGVAYPSNDSNAVGITYEDVDVTYGDMPASIVLSGVIYEDKLAITGADYSSVTLKNLVSPKDQGWQERSGTGSEQNPYVYTDSTDTTVNTSKTYYIKDDEHTAVTDYASVLNPKEEGWYESDGQSPATYTLSTDTEGDSSKTYYEKSDVRLSSEAKTALQALGFVFKNSPTVMR